MSASEANLFRTVEVSDPRFETEGLRRVTVKSPALRSRGDITLWVPPGVSDGMPWAILLHGVYGSHWAWTEKGGAHRTARRLVEGGDIPPMVLAMPSDGLWGDGSGYVPHVGPDYERWIVEDVPAAVRHVVGAGRLRKKFFLCGLSMGGFGALRLGAKHASHCAGISAHSSITDFDQMGQFVEEGMGSYPVSGTERSVLKTIRANRAALPPLRFDCGAADLLIEANRSLHRDLGADGIPHVYEEFEGGHEWPYWERHVADSLRFFGSAL